MVARLGDRKAIKAARVPIALLAALKTYAQGSGMKAEQLAPGAAGGGRTGPGVLPGVRERAEHRPGGWRGRFDRCRHG